MHLNITTMVRMVMEGKDYPLNTNYTVYPDGRIYSKRFKKFLTPKKNWDGYDRIQIWKDGECQMISWHRVVAETFIPHPSECNVVNHKIGIKNDNRVDNLEWVTQKENIEHSIKTNLRPLKKTIVYDKKGNFIGQFNSLKEAANAVGARDDSASRVANGYLKSTHGYIFKFIETYNDYRNASTQSIDTTVETGTVDKDEDIV